jgi:uncharacterized protein (UPF0210 family)
VQTTRIATRVLQDNVKGTKEITALAESLEQACLRHGISFLSLGSTSPAHSDIFLNEHNFLSDFASSLQFTSFTVAWQPGWDFQHAKRLAEEIFRLAELTNGEANFRFAVSFNCKPGIPFFPAAEAPSLPHISSSNPSTSFAIGTENSHLLYRALSSVTNSSDAPMFHSALKNAQEAIERCLNTALQPVERIAKEIEDSYSGTTFQYLGIDTSIAPGLQEHTTITAAFETLALLQNRFGNSGTLAITERITRALQSSNLKVKKTGYCGLMLPVCEDRGISKAVVDGNISIQSLLFYSAVCGVGLDTIPVPGPEPNTTVEERQHLVTQAAAVLLDVAALSQRLGGKQLSVRLLPVVGAVPGEKTQYRSPYLVDSVVMSL